ncbi:MAG: 3-dehydroquinate synthase [Myxococcota bacterium]|nr:3-dehydroquinate synthase [Myxococcota bacterium]
MLISVDLGERSYPIEVVDGGLAGLGASMAQVLPPGRCVLVTNPVVGALYAPAALESLERAGFVPDQIEVPDGEIHKTVESWRTLVEQLVGLGIHRRTPVVALGGGVTGDLVGFAAATALRGVPLVQVPTTLLAMVDSAVGGKTGVNTPQGKNLVGAFYQPSLVYAALDTLHTLPPEEIRCGLGEVIKHGLIGDPTLFERCEREGPAILRLDADVVSDLVVRSCRLKARVVAADEREQGQRVALNFGHTVGHALETALGHGQLRHGECVALGALAETRWSQARGRCDPGVVDRLERVLDQLGLPARPPPFDWQRLVESAGYDKKRARGTMNIAIIEEMGRVSLDSLSVGEIDEMLDMLKR